MEKKHCKQVIIGLPSSGKTTFIAAFWHTVTSEEIKCSLVLERLSGTREHLNNIRKNWLNCKKVARTTDFNIVSMQLKDEESNKNVEITMPDISGEAFNAQLRYRKWEPSYDNLVRESKGGLMFINPHKVEDPGRIDEADQLMDAVELLDGCNEMNNHKKCAKIKEDMASYGTNNKIAKDETNLSLWNLDKSPTQVKLVELLQFINFRLNPDSKFRIGVIVSAWDIIKNNKDKKLTPVKWIEQRMPLLYQYLKANNEKFPFKVYGVSAQGGEYENSEKSRLQEKDNPTERIIVIDDTSESHDITKPVKWLMNG